MQKQRGRKNTTEKVHPENLNRRTNGKNRESEKNTTEKVRPRKQSDRKLHDLFPNQVFPWQLIQKLEGPVF